ncbi:MAG: hypothetical protein ACRDPA_16025, partial [Solirubrobacteraceae bacterium]
HRDIRIMNKRVPATLAAFAIAVLLGLSCAPSADATANLTTTRVTINHQVIHAGNTAAITGSVSPNLRGHLVVLQRYAAGGWHTLSSKRLSAASRATFTVRPAAGKYSYRIVHRTERAWRASMSPRVSLTVQRPFTATLATYAGDGGEWQGPTVHIPAADYAVHWTNSCSGGDTGISIDWNGSNNGFEYLSNDAATPSGTWYGHAGARNGYFSVSDLCTSWSARVTYQAWH